MPKKSKKLSKQRAGKTLSRQELQNLHNTLPLRIVARIAKIPKSTLWDLLQRGS